MDTTCELVFKNQKKHKNKPVQFVSVAGGVQKRLETNLKHRKSCRLTVFDNVRNLSEPTETPVKQDDAQDKQERRRQQLEKWKQEKEKKKKEQAVGKKKPFVAGVVPAPLKFVLPPPPKHMPSTSGRVTRSQSARVSKKPEKPQPQSFAPRNASFRPPQLKNVTTLAMVQPKKDSKAAFNFTFDPVMPAVEETTMTVKSTRSKTNIVSKQATKEPIVRMNTRSKVTLSNVTNKVAKNKITKSPKKTKKVTENHALIHIPQVLTNVPAPNVTQMSRSRRSRQCHSEENRKLDHDSPILHNSVITPQRLTPNTVPKSESHSEEKLRSPKEAIVEITPTQKTNIFEEDNRTSPCVTLSRGKDNARREMKKKLQEGLLDDYVGDADGFQHFRRQLQSVIARITARCDEWDAIYESTALPEFVQEQVLGTLGQARLLMSQKLQQFSSLVDRSEALDAGAGLVTPADLQGFWDMVYIQIENVDLRFKKLDELRAREWAEEAPKPVKKKPVARPSKRASTKPAGPSRLREMIAAARKAKQEQESASSDDSTALAGASTSSLTPGGGSKTFEAGFFSVRSPVRSPAPATPRNRASLLKNVLSSEARKASASKQTTSYAMLRASVLGKNFEIEGVAPLEQTPKLPTIDLNATPARSILKSTTKPSVKKSAKKSIKTVLFHQSDDESADAKAKELEGNTDSGLSSMDVEKEPENKENRRKSKLVRQEAVAGSPTVTRSRRSMSTPQEEVRTTRTSRRKKALQESETNIVEESSRNRRKSSIKEDLEEDIPKVTPRRSRRSKAIEDLIDFGTPKGTTRTHRSRTKAVDV